MTVRIVIVDDQEPVRRGIRSLLASCQDWWAKRQTYWKQRNWRANCAQM